MSEALYETGGLAREAIGLQLAYGDRLIEKGRDRVATPSTGGMGPYTLSGTLGTEITIQAQTYSVEELTEYAQIHVRVHKGIQFTVEVRGGEVGNIVDQDGEVVRDQVIIEYLAMQIARAKEKPRARMGDLALKIVGMFTK